MVYIRSVTATQPNTQSAHNQSYTTHSVEIWGQQQETVLEMKSFLHWNAFILMKFSSLAAAKVVILTTFAAASDKNLIKMMTFPFHQNDYLSISL